MSVIKFLNTADVHSYDLSWKLVPIKEQKQEPTEYLSPKIPKPSILVLHFRYKQRHSNFSLSKYQNGLILFRPFQPWIRKEVLSAKY